MKNINYDLIKLLHTSLDKIWRLEKHYIKDAVDAKHDPAKLKKMLEEEEKHAKMLVGEIKARMDARVFD
ncbi:MAG: hypothetical protein M1334_01220 [Patescibacteria group bacterium]|nr:hypothetical protein [Patescibacteria group bacterium]